MDGTTAEHLRITPAGNVGVGTGSPTSKLHVNGDIYASGSVTAASFPTTSDARLKTIHADCQAKALDDLIETRGRTCFAGCPQPTNASSACWTECFFATVLGDGHNTSITPAGGVNASDIVEAWLKGFDDPASGGCAPCPPNSSSPSGSSHRIFWSRRLKRAFSGR